MFKTIDPKSKSKFTLGKILFPLFILSIVVVVAIYIISVIPMYYYYKDTLLEYSFNANLVVITMLIINIFYYVFFRGRNKRKFIGVLELKENAILLNEKTFNLDEIKEIRFKGNDIKGEFRGSISNGTHNEVIINLKDSNKISYFFEQTKEEKLKDKKVILEHYNKLGILSTANLQNILANTNYY